MRERNGKLKSRDSSRLLRKPSLGYYIIVTDTKETEKNYLEGLRESIPQELRDRLVIKVQRARTQDLVDVALELASTSPTYREIWIVFDRDQVKNFDEIIKKANKNDIKVGWSNPCIEIWFYAYFGSMPYKQDSVACWHAFKELFQKRIGQDYDKDDKSIYRKLVTYGDEQKALQIAQQKLNSYSCQDQLKPSQMNPATTLHELVGEILSKSNNSKVK